MKKKIKLILSKLKILLYLNNLLIFFRNNQGANINYNSYLNLILKLFHQNDIYVIPFFGTLLGIYREGGVISHDNDMDFAIIYNKNTKKIINFFIQNNFIKTLDCTINETNQLILEKYRYKKIEIDIFYIYENEKHYYFYDNESDSGLSTIEEINNNIVVNPYLNKITKFYIKNISLKSLNFIGPHNTKTLLTELYGNNFMTPDKFWRQSKRKLRQKTNLTISINEY